ncbi:hypothetical protein PsorP6_016063 [Peronosclerospora sorghi]|uniref:Uncharacterized protein n=1 Tax=Peronosclerospora sorghi TaxID=230839 RepID=A0ACC0WPR2_9STRA|nr:hypothetical protein PsorP6_016063 [Peronosclerospora sorghi]
MDKLRSEGFEHHTKLGLLFTKYDAISLVSRFSRVLLMDCTYKTNTVAFAFLAAETEKYYLWTLEGFKASIVVQPVAIMTDRDLGLMNAVARVFPGNRNLLCRWHINKNV